MHEGASSWADLGFHFLEWIQAWGWMPLFAFFGVVLLGIGLWTGNWPGWTCVRCRRARKKEAT